MKKTIETIDLDVLEGAVDKIIKCVDGKGSDLYPGVYLTAPQAEALLALVDDYTKVVDIAVGQFERAEGLSS